VFLPQNETKFRTDYSHTPSIDVLRSQYILK
jgi:hypothetical protein